MEESRKRQRVDAPEQSDQHKANKTIVCRPNPFDLLNDDLAAHVFSFVGSGVECVRTLALVCRRFGILMHLPAIWHKTIFAEKLVVQQLANPDLSLLPMANISNGILLASQLFRYPVRSVNVPKELESMLFGLPFLSLERMRSSLTSLTLEMSDILCPSEIIADCSGLTYLALSYSPRTDFGREHYPGTILDRHFAYNHALTRLCKLECIVVDEVLISQSTLQKILQHNPLMRTLTFNFSQSWLSFVCADAALLGNDESDESEQELKRQLSIDTARYLLAISGAMGLTSLDMGWFYKYEYTLQDSLCLSSLTNLTNLNIRPNDISGETLAMLMTAMPRLQQFYCGTILLPFPVYFPKSNVLRFFRMQGREDGIGQRGFDTLAKLFQGLPCLTELDIDARAFIAHKDFDPRYWPNLKIVNLAGDDIKVLTEEVVDNLAALPALDSVLVSGNRFAPRAYTTYEYLTKLTRVSKIEFHGALNPAYDEAFSKLIDHIQQSLPNCSVKNSMLQLMRQYWEHLEESLQDAQ